MAVSIDRSEELELFGVGTTLRQARERQGLSLADVERDTCIRGANLAAIEEERFDELPGDVYAAGFIRSYAATLGLDGDRFVARFWELRRVEHAPPALPQLLRRDEPRLPLSRGMLLAAVLVVLAVGIAIGVARYDRSDPAPAPPAAAPARLVPHAPSLLLRATGGRSWVAARVGGREGKLLWQGTLKRHGMLRFGLGRPIWVGVGHAGKITMIVGRKQIRVAPSVHRLLFSADAVRRG